MHAHAANTMQVVYNPSEEEDKKQGSVGPVCPFSQPSQHAQNTSAALR